MRNTIAIILLTITFTLSAQTNKTFHDPRFVGSWTGSEKDQQQSGLEKHWIMHRFADGTFILLFTAIQDGEVTNHAEKGKWWNEKDEFHELHFESGMTDIYSYVFIDDFHVKFKSKVLFEANQESYEFVDTKLIDN